MTTMAIDNKDKKVLNVPHLRFPEFSGEWENTELQYIAPNICSGKDKPTSNGTVALYGSTGIIGMTRLASYNEEIVLVARVGANAGQLQITTIPCGVTDNTLIINAKEWNRYIYYYLQHYNLNRLVFGSGQPLITGSMLKKLKIIYGEESERNKIVNLLCLLDERIATQNKIIEKYESLIKGLNNILLYGTGGKSVCLGDILLERSERSRTNNQHEVLSSTVKGIFSQREYFSKDIASENNVGYKIIRLHDVVLSPQNLWMGNINYNDRFEIGIVSPSYKVFSIADGYDNQFVAAMLKTHRALYSYMMVSEQGASIVRRNLNMEAFSQLVFKIPSLDKQREIGCAISLLKSQLKTANKLIRAYTSQKQYLLRQMFI